MKKLAECHTNYDGTHGNYVENLAKIYVKMTSNISFSQNMNYTEFDKNFDTPDNEKLHLEHKTYHYSYQCRVGHASTTAFAVLKY